MQAHMHKLARWVVLVLCNCLLPTLRAQPTQTYPSGLFGPEEPLQFTLLVNYKQLLRDRGEEREYHAATVVLRYPMADTITLKVRARGKHRRDPSVCGFPPLLLNFPKTKILHTVFAGANRLKLVTHCRNEELVLREYLVYKLYNIISNYSFRVRLCRIRYEDMADKRKPEVRYAFLIEDENDLARRCGGAWLADELLVRMDATDNTAMARLALFQYMIGNTDWSVPYRHNIKVLFVERTRRTIPVPYDFDYTGIVWPPYAKPPPEIGIKSVRQRIFRGYTYPEAVYAALLLYYQSKRTAIYQVYQASPLITPKYRRQTLKYLDRFYETLNSPKHFDRRIKAIGRQNERRRIMIKGLD